MDITTLTINGISCCIRFVQTHNCLPLSSGDAVIQALVCDQNTAMFAPQQCTRIIVPNGESSKTSLILHDLVSSFAALSLTRDSMIVGFGGGAVTDLCAFAAHIYLRGIGVVLVPTSLLAMVDAAVGGKTGIDFAGYKNIVGSFYPAKEIRINPEFTYSLSDREYKSGLAEVIKAALLRDAGLLSLLEKKRDSVMKRELQTVKDCIRAAVLVKAAIVMEDPQEKGIRAYLNLGHTFGHALEACMGLGVWTHGEAVAWGIARAMQAEYMPVLLRIHGQYVCYEYCEAMGMMLMLSQYLLSYC